jgi:hypothetical protein
MIVLGCAVALAGCGQKGLRQLSSTGSGPDEFLVMPVEPLSAPASYAALPAPTPGGSNLTDPNPKGDAVAALGGNAAALNAGQPVPGSDGALVAAASRYGVEQNVRTSLAEADAKFRKRQRRSGRIKLFPVDRYEQAYRKESLDPHNENTRFRQSGFGTPSAPPADE